MNSANKTALDTADMIDVGKSPCRFKSQIRARITKAWLVNFKEINQTLRLLADMTVELYHLWYSIDEDAHGWIAFSTEDSRQHRLQ